MKKMTVLELHRLDAEHYRQLAKLPVTVVLDNVRSEMNVGSIFRTADAFLVERICLCGITSTPPRPEIHKTALGAEEAVVWTHHATVMEALGELRRDGYTLLAVEQVHGSTSLEQFACSPGVKYAIVLGHEVRGVAQEAVDACDGCLELPQHGTKHSLNVACTAAIVMWHFYQQLAYHT